MNGVILFLILLFSLFIHHTLVMRPLRGSERRPDLSPLDLAESDDRERLDLLDGGWRAFGCVAWASVSAVEPVHRPAVVPPDAEGKNHASRHRLSHGLHGTQLCEHGRAVVCAVVVVHLRDGSAHIEASIGNDLAVLDIETVHADKSAVLRRELGDDGEWTAGIDLEAGAVVGVVAAEGVVTTAILVANAGGLGALVASALVDTGLAARMRRELSGSPVGLPDVQLVAADALCANIALLLVSGRTSRLDLQELTSPLTKGVT